MNNLQRLQMEVDVKLEQSKLTIYLQENGLQPFDEYKPDSATNKKQIYQSALSILESLANSPEHMKNYKHEDMSVSEFHENLMSRIDQLDRTVRKLKTDEQVKHASDFFILFQD